MGHQKEYLPVNTLNNIDYFNNRSSDILVKNGTAIIKNVTNEVPNLSFDVETNDTVILELPRLYYLGYTIKVNNEKINYEENEYGFINITLNKNSHIKMTYTGTTTSKIFNILALTNFVIFIIFIKKQNIMFLQNS